MTIVVLTLNECHLAYVHAGTRASCVLTCVMDIRNVCAISSFQNWL